MDNDSQATAIGNLGDVVESMKTVNSSSVQSELQRRRVAEVNAVCGQCAAGRCHPSRGQHVLRPGHVVGAPARVVPATASHQQTYTIVIAIGFKASSHHIASKSQDCGDASARNTTRAPNNMQKLKKIEKLKSRCVKRNEFGWRYTQNA